MFQTLREKHVARVKVLTLQLKNLQDGNQQVLDVNMLNFKGTR